MARRSRSRAPWPTNRQERLDAHCRGGRRDRCRTRAHRQSDLRTRCALVARRTQHRLPAAARPQSRSGFITEVYVAPASGGAPRSITRALDGISCAPIGWPTAPGCLWPRRPGDDGRVIQPLSGRRSGCRWVTWCSRAVLAPTSRAARRTVRVHRHLARTPAELYVMTSASATPKALTAFNAWASTVALGRTNA